MSVRSARIRLKRSLRSEPVTLADLDASVGTGPDVPADDVAVRYYTDEAFLTAIRLRRNSRSPD